MKIHAEIEVVIRIPGTIVYDAAGFEEWLDGNPATNDSLFEYIQSDPDWLEGSEFPDPDVAEHEVIETELVSVNRNQEPRTASTGADS